MWESTCLFYIAGVEIYIWVAVLCLYHAQVEPEESYNEGALVATAIYNDDFMTEGLAQLKISNPDPSVIWFFLTCVQLFKKAVLTIWTKLPDFLRPFGVCVCYLTAKKCRIKIIEYFLVLLSFGNIKLHCTMK